MHGIDLWPINVKNIEGETFLVCSRNCTGRPWGRLPLLDHRLFSTFFYTLSPWDLDKIRDLVYSLDQAKVSVFWKRQFVARPDMIRMKEALTYGELLLYAVADPDEAALKDLREKIQHVLTGILTQERAEAARLKAVHHQRSPLEKANAYVAAGAKGLGEAGISFLTWLKDVHDVLSIHERQRRMMRAAWETHNSAWDGDWVEAFKHRLIAAEHKEVMEALGFDPLRVDREMLTKAYEITNLVWEDEDTRTMLVRFAGDYARAQHSLEWTKIAGGAAFDIVLTVVLAAFIGGLGAASLFGRNARLLRPMKKLGGLFEELVKWRGKVKLRRDRDIEPPKVSRLENYVTDEKVPIPEPPPKGKPRQEDSDKAEGDDADSTVVSKCIPNKVNAGTGGGIRYVETSSTNKMVSQELGMSCGAACARQILLDNNVDIPESVLREVAKVSPKTGVGVDGIVDALNKFDPDNSYIGGGVGPEAFNALNARGPWIARVNPSTGPHFVIVDGVDNGRVVLRDPWGADAPGPGQGLTGTVEMDDFMEHWRLGVNQAIFVDK